MVKIKQIKFESPKLKQSGKTDQLSYTNSTLQRFRNDINMLSPYRIQPNITNKRTKKASNTSVNNKSHCEHDLKRPQMTSNDLKRPR